MIVAGIALLIYGLVLEGEMTGPAAISGIVIAVFGFLLLFTGQMSPAAAQSKGAQMISYVLILGAVLAFASVGLYAVAGWNGGFAINMAAAAIVLLGVLIWPSLCCMGQSKVTSKVVGVARAHERITIDELARLSGLPVDEVSSVLYDAIGTGKLSGRMEGSTFIRSAGVTAGAGEAKVLVICRFCGAKTEQGKSKCDNCGADL